ncbi:MAG TPA: hypothetical protein VJZ91_02935 [Blastocatellia bacterium]|nr:hypothetical protein [Blastocatellia bacterium]
MSKGYEVELSRAPDGQVIFTRDPSVPLQHECVVGKPEEQADTVFIHLQILHDGSRFPIWVCEPPEVINDPQMVSRFTKERKAEIIEAFKQWQDARRNP